MASLGSDYRVFLAIPNYGCIHPETVASIMQASQQVQVFTRVGASCSLLAMSFNGFWCQALNARKELGLTHFAMIHSDIEAEAGWLDKLLSEQQRVKADVLSAIIPIKSELGDTSTGIYDHYKKCVSRLSLERVHQLPQTFDITAVGDRGQALVVNTGLWICDFTKPWVEKVHFAILDHIVKEEDGQFQPRNFPEDWNFSIQCVGFGVKVFATRCVKIDHLGNAKYPNYTVWGTNKSGK